MEVVLPDPCNPTIITEFGRRDVKSNRLDVPPSISTISSYMILTTCCPGERCRKTSWPTALLLTRSMNSLTTLKLTSASSRAMRISRIARSRCSGDKRLSPRKSFRTFLSLSDNASNIGQSHGSDLLAHAKRRGYGRAERVSRRQSLSPASQVNEVKTAACGKERKICRARVGHARFHMLWLIEYILSTINTAMGG